MLVAVCTFFLVLIFPLSTTISAHHTRLYACALASDDPSAFMGGSSIGGGLWQSDDTGRTWKQLGWKHVKCYSVDIVQKSNGKIIYEACGNGLLRSTDAGVSWRMTTDWRMTEVMDVAVDQKHPQNIYIATAGAIWKSDDAGANWFETDAELSSPIFVSELKIDPDNNSMLHASTSRGIFASHDGGVDWQYKAPSPNEWCSVLYQNLKYSGGKDGIENINAGPKNIHSLLVVGNRIIAGSLNGGIWLVDMKQSKKICTQIGLEKLQIWKLKSYIVK